MEPLTHRLPDISDVEPFSEKDRECFAEIKRVLEKHGCVHRFGVCLLHQHFDLAEDEILTESWDPATRTLTSRPVKRKEVGTSIPIQTSWRLDTEDPKPRADCHPRPDGGHYS